MIVGRRAGLTVLRYPLTPMGQDADDYHGELIADPCRWLERTSDPVTASWIAAQNEVSEDGRFLIISVSAGTAPQTRLYVLDLTDPAADDPDQYRWLRSYSPLHNLRAGAEYPATLLLTGDHDDRLVPGHSFKFAVALQAAQGGDALVLIRIDTSAGHGTSAPTSKVIAESADVLAFLRIALRLTESDDAGMGEIGTSTLHPLGAALEGA